MGHIRWLKISEALARLGHQVDIATNEPRWRDSREPIGMVPGLPDGYRSKESTGARTPGGSRRFSIGDSKPWRAMVVRGIPS